LKVSTFRKIDTLMLQINFQKEILRKLCMLLQHHSMLLIYINMLEIKLRISINSTYTITCKVITIKLSVLEVFLWGYNQIELCLLCQMLRIRNSWIAGRCLLLILDLGWLLLSTAVFLLTWICIWHFVFQNSEPKVL
jgi:hypothetical protein